MISIDKRLSWLLAAGLALAVALPTAAQQGGGGGVQPGQPAQPVPNPRAVDSVRCERLGLALAVVSQDGTVADILGPADAAGRANPGSSISRPVTRTIVIDAPAKVGVCADFSGFWGAGAAGSEAAVLTLVSIEPPQTTNTPAASDQVEETKTGPATSQKALKAAVLIDQVGKYLFAARLTVHAAATGGQAVQDALQIPLVVEFREKPKPGAIEGTVLDADNHPIEGARVRIAPLPNASSARPRAELPVQPPSTLLDGDEVAADESTGSAGENVVTASLAPDQDPGGRGSTARDPNTAITDKDGKYHLDAMAGRYIVNAEAKGFKTQWYDGKDSARAADPVTVTAATTSSGIDFHLAAGTNAPQVTPAPRQTAVPRPTQAPREMGSIKGRVTDSQGTALGGAFVAVMMTGTLGARPLEGWTEQQPGAPNPGSAAGMTARTNADGTYELKVPVGKWLVSARAEVGYQAQWYDGKSEAKDATPVEVVKDTAADNVNFALVKLPSAAVSGLVTKGGAPAKGVAVAAVQRGADGKALRLDSRSLAGYRLSAVTKDDGSFTLVLPPAANWAISASLRATTNRDPGVVQWFDGKQTLAEADLLDLADGATRSDVSFAFPQ